MRILLTIEMPFKALTIRVQVNPQPPTFLPLLASLMLNNRVIHAPGLTNKTDSFLLPLHFHSDGS